MVKCPDALAKMICNNAEWFERLFISCVHSNLPLFNKVRNILCFKSGTKKHIDDFDTPFHNILYLAIRDYNDLFVDHKDIFNPMSTGFLKEWLVNKASAGDLVMASEVEEVIACFNAIMQSSPCNEENLHFANLGIASYLKARRASSIVSHASLGANSLDDLALMCEQDIDLISSLDNAGRLVSDVPDRVHLQDMDLFDDPNKVLVETIDSDIPMLNEALGGFRKKCAYMIIGGTGSGKTIIACQLASAFSYTNGANGLFISTEQQHDELYRRIVSNRCKIPFSIISKGIFESVINAREKDRFIQFRKDISLLNKGDIRVVNWGNFEKQPGTKIIKMIENEIDMYEEETGRKVDYVILDWIGGALGSMAEAGDKTRHIYQEAADAMDELARKRGIVTVALAQAHVSAVNKVQISAADLAECKSMTRNYTGVIGITALFSEEYAKQLADEKNKKRKDFRVGSDIDDAVSYSYKQYLYISKARYGVQKAIPFKREYEFQRMEAW